MLWLTNLYEYGINQYWAQTHMIGLRRISFLSQTTSTSDKISESFFYSINATSEFSVSLGVIFHLIHKSLAAPSMDKYQSTKKNRRKLNRFSCDAGNNIVVTMHANWNVNIIRSMQRAFFIWISDMRSFWCSRMHTNPIFFWVSFFFLFVNGNMLKWNNEHKNWSLKCLSVCLPKWAHSHLTAEFMLVSKRLYLWCCNFQFHRGIRYGRISGQST